MTPVESFEGGRRDRNYLTKLEAKEMISAAIKQYDYEVQAPRHEAFKNFHIVWLAREQDKMKYDDNQRKKLNIVLGVGTFLILIMTATISLLVFLGFGKGHEGKSFLSSAPTSYLAQQNHPQDAVAIFTGRQ